MKKLEFDSLSSKVVSLAKRITNEEVTQAQLDYLIQTNEIDEDQLYDAVDYINNEINKSILLYSVLMISFLFSVFGLLGIFSL